MQIIFIIVARHIYINITLIEMVGTENGFDSIQKFAFSFLKTKSTNTTHEGLSALQVLVKYPILW